MKVILYVAKVNSKCRVFELEPTRIVLVKMHPLLLVLNMLKCIRNVEGDGLRGAFACRSSKQQKFSLIEKPRDLVRLLSIPSACFVCL